MLTNNHTPFSCYWKLFNNYSQDKELVLILVFTLQLCYVSYIGVMFEFHSCPPAISHAIFSKILWWLLKTLFSEKTLALSFEELLEVEKEFELYPAKTVIKVNYYCLQLCSLILPVSVHLDNTLKDRMHIQRYSIRGCKIKSNALKKTPSAIRNARINVACASAIETSFVQLLFKWEQY